MKFTAAALFAALGLADAKRRPTSVAQKKRNLMRSAKPVNKDGSTRRLNGEWEITADYSIAFYDCVSLKIIDDDLFDENLYQLAYSGQIVAQKSFIMFDVLATEDVYYQSGSGSNLWMVELEQWLEAMAEANNEMEEEEEYCNACEESYDVCYPDQDEQQQQEEQDDNQEDNQEEEGDNEDGEDRKRKLVKKPLTPAAKAKRDALAHIMGKRRKLQGKCEIYVDCYECEYRGCFNEEEEQDNDNQNYCDQDQYYPGCTFEEGEAYEFVKEAQCAETGQIEYNANGEQMELKAGLMCNEDGTGVEMAIFIDDECQIYDKARSFSSFEDTYVYDILKEAKYLIETPFKESIDCLQCEYVALEDEDEDQDQDNNQDEEEAEVSETCDNVMGDALDLATCGWAEADNNNDNNNNNNQEYDISWYEYDIDEDADVDQVCLKLQEYDGEYGDFHIYEPESEYGGGGHFFDYGASSSGGGSGKAGKIFGIIVAVLVVVVAGVFIGQSFAKKNDSKKQPLVSQNKGGAMA